MWSGDDMEPVKLFDSELKIMEILWENEPISAKELSLLAADRIGWNKNTTYTVITKLVEKSYIMRQEPNFICSSRIKKEDLQISETRNLIDRLYNGSKRAFFASFLNEGSLTTEELDEIRNMIKKR
jgi:predicted transcriptional regulator